MEAKKNFFTRGTVYDILGSLIYAIGIYCFASNAEFAPGGISGIAIILNHFLGTPIGILSILANIPIVILSYRYLGKGFIIRTMFTLVVSSIFMDVVAPVFGVYHGEKLLSSVFSGALSGVGLALVYLNKSCTGGSDLIIMSLKKLRPHLSVGQITMVIDGMVILLGGVVFRNIDSLLYGFVYTAITTLVMDKVMYGYVSGKLVYIISEEGDEISRVIYDKIDRGSTGIRSYGTYTKAERNLIMCACSKSQVNDVRRIVKSIDPNALCIVSSFDEVYGEGFLPIEES